MKNIILCADDYGQNPAISQAILALGENNRLSAISCMANSDYWQLHAKWLLPLKDKLDIGLHLNLTEGKPLSPEFKKRYGDKMFSLGKLLILSSLKSIHRNALASEVEAQLDRFIECIGRAPDFVDGHQHVHHFPVIRDILLALYERRLRKQGVYLRCSHELQKGFSLKKSIIACSGAKNFKEMLQKLNIPHNTTFSGIYSFKKSAEYAKIFPTFLQMVSNQGLIMCHPGLSGGSDADPIYATRHYEYEYFASDAFLADCARLQVKITRFKS